MDAANYVLTTNSTAFSVDVPGPGIIVLGETHYPGDFIAKVNGKPQAYIRVNEASKGIWVDKAGTYEVMFTYRPEKLGLSLMLSAIGLILLMLMIKLSVVFQSGKDRSIISATERAV